MPEHVFGESISEILDEHWPFWTRADKAHLPLQDIDELREFIDAELSQEPSHLSYPRIIVCAHHRTCHFFSITHHSTKFMHDELSPIQSHSLLMVESRPFGSQFNQNGHHHHQRRKQNEEKSRYHNIHDPLDDSHQSPQRRLIDADDAGAVLYGTISRYDIRPSSFDRRDRVTVSHVAAELEVSVLDTDSGEYLMQDERFAGSGSFFLTAQPSARREKDVLIRIANDIVSRVIDGW